MAGTVIRELVSSRKATVANDRSSTLDWAIRLTGSDILDDVISMASLVLPQCVYEPSADLWLVPSKTSYTPLGPGRRPDVDAQAVWDIVCTYVDPAAADDQHKLDVGECRLQGSTTGGTARILVSLQTVNSYARPGGPQAPNFKNAVNVTRDNEVKGVDKVVPACKFSVETRMGYGLCTNVTLLGLEALTGCYNNDTWWGRPAGEVLFLGADVTVGSKGGSTLVYHFVRIPNVAGLMLGDIGPIAKLGHHYLWVLFEETPEAASSYMPAVPKAVYVERIYEPVNFALLGLPVDAPPIAPWPPA